MFGQQAGDSPANGALSKARGLAANARDVAVNPKGALLELHLIPPCAVQSLCHAFHFWPSHVDFLLVKTISRDRREQLTLNSILSSEVTKQ